MKAEARACPCARTSEGCGLIYCAALRLPPGGSLLPLPQACAVPRRRFRGRCDLNTYFTLLGLVEDGRRDLAEAMLQNTAHQTDNLGHVPNGNRGYLLSRSQPPFFHRVVARVCAVPAAEAFASYLSQTRREHAF